MSQTTLPCYVKPLGFLPNRYQELGMAGEQMLDWWLKKLGYKSHPHLWSSYIQFVNQGVDNRIVHAEKGIINFEVKNFKVKTSKLSIPKMQNEVLDIFLPHLNQGEMCILLVSHDKVVPKSFQPKLNSLGIKLFVYKIQVLPEDPTTFQKAVLNLYHSQLFFLLKKQ